ncbi:Uncharacterized protein TCM_003006 [Theobroma cacao]|uniref:Uncharacterized protein n=1 Tax=Theobroma cacao TaxID=3641 RepID=A0A061DPF9_THECC|nr:Uncharacterized protein TCM_003006 [Theobroma cacao]
MQTFYNGLNGHARTTIDVATEGALMAISIDEAYDLLEEIVTNNYQWLVERLMHRRVARIHDVDAFSVLSAQRTALTKTLESFGINRLQSPFIACELCKDNHASH